MSYTALYRKFRPDSFQDVKGQDAIVRTLKNQIRAQRIGHAYLFCGTRGTGKTTVAKILAKAVNCEHPIDGNPCNECETCKAIAAGNSMNVIEIDAASNNGVDNIREIREEVAYSPTSGKYKVYIIDEVHMLSIGAFNALLKTLEEPPSYVIFILATTEAHKIPITILSRCQRYDFKRIARTTIVDRLRELMDEEQVEVEDKALRYIAKKGDGSMRDALSLLDQCIAFYLGEKLTYEHVLDVLGAVDTDEFSKLLREVLDGDVTQVILHLENMIMQGRDLTQLVNDFTWYLRNLLLLKSSDNMEDVLDVSAENLDGDLPRPSLGDPRGLLGDARPGHGLRLGAVRPGKTICGAVGRKVKRKVPMVSRKVWVANLVVSLILAALVMVDAFLFDIPFIYNDPPNFWGLGGFLLVAVSSGFQLWRSRRGSA